MHARYWTNTLSNDCHRPKFWNLALLIHCFPSYYRFHRFAIDFIAAYRRLGGAQPGNRFVSFVRAYARSGCLVELDQKLCGPGFSLFPFGRVRSWGFSFVGPGGPGELSLFPFGPGSFPFSLPPPPNLLSNFSWAYRYLMPSGLLGAYPSS